MIKKGYTRISSIISQWNQFGHIPKDILESKAKLGTEVHDAIDGDHKGIYLPLGNKANGYFLSKKSWESVFPYKVVKSEERYYDDRLMITGCIDCLIKAKGYEYPVLVDFKTSAQASPLIWRLQGTFYHYLVSSRGDTRIDDTFLFVQLSKDGSLPKVHEFKYDKRILDICFSAYNCYKYLNV